MVASKQHFQIVSSTSSTLWGNTFHPGEHPDWPAQLEGHRGPYPWCMAEEDTSKLQSLHEQLPPPHPYPTSKPVPRSSCSEKGREGDHHHQIYFVDFGP